jgi:CMP/dCMP kinase
LAKPLTITIDGFAASGKSTVAALLAQRLGYLYFDTGIMYRAVTWAVLDRGLDPLDGAAVSELAEKWVIEVKAAGLAQALSYLVLVDGQDVSHCLRDPKVEAYVSRVASYPRVRAALTQQQRRIAAGGRPIIMVGRDIGTVVLPEADLKIFMQASAEERARRRYKDIIAQSMPADLEHILAAIKARDQLDKDNPVSPTLPAADAIVIDTDGLSIEEVVAQLKELVLGCNDKTI